MSRPIEVFNVRSTVHIGAIVLGKDPNPFLPESRRSNGGLYSREVRAGSRQKTFLSHLSGLPYLKCSQASTDPRVRSQQSSTERKGVNAIMTKRALCFYFAMLYYRTKLSVMCFKQVHGTSSTTATVVGNHVHLLFNSAEVMSSTLLVKTRIIILASVTESVRT